MADFPQTYQVVRRGTAETVTVGNKEELLALRTELALMSSFAQGATQELVEALEARLAALKSAGTKESGQAANDVEDMLGILRDAMTPATAEVIARIDADFPQARGDVDMASVEKESGSFHEDAAGQAAASGKPAAGRLSQAFKQALLKSAVAAKEAAQTQAANETAPAPAPVSDSGEPLDQQSPLTDATAAENVKAVAEAPKLDPVEAALEQAIQNAEGSPASEVAEEVEEAAEIEEAAEVEQATEDDDEALEASEVEEVLEAEEAVEAEEEECMDAEEAIEAESLAEMAELAEELSDEDPIEAALAEALETAAEVNGQADDPVEAILAGQAEAGEDAAAAAAAEQLLAGQPASEGEISPEQLADVLLAGQVVKPTAADEVDDSIEKQWAAVVQAGDASQPGSQNASAEATPEDTGGQPERERADANSNTPMVSQDAAGGADVAVEKVAQVIADSQNDIDAIASAFEEATSSLGAIESEVSAAAIGQDDSLLPEADMSDCVEPAGDATDLPETTAPGASDNPAWAATGAAATPAEPAFNLPSLNLRGELQAIRQSLQGGLERLIQLLDRVDQVHVEAENRLAKARNYQQAAQKAQEVSQMLVQAQTDAAEAKAAFDSAQRRLDEAQSAWENARRNAEDAAF